MGPGKIESHPAARPAHRVQKFLAFKFGCHDLPLAIGRRSGLCMGVHFCNHYQYSTQTFFQDSECFCKDVIAQLFQTLLQALSTSITSSYIQLQSGFYTNHYLVTCTLDIRLSSSYIKTAVITLPAPKPPSPPLACAFPVFQRKLGLVSSFAPSSSSFLFHLSLVFDDTVYTIY